MACFKSLLIRIVGASLLTVLYSALGDSQDIAAAKGRSLDGTAESESLVREARRLIVDALPEDRQRAQDLLVEAIRISPNHTEAYAELSRFLLWQVSMRLTKPHALAQAAGLARHVRDLEPNRPLGSYLLSEMMIALGQEKPALELFEATRKSHPNHSDTASFEARFYSESQPEKALSSATKALSAGVSMDELSPAITVALEERAKGDSRLLSDTLKSFVTVYPDRWLWHRMALSYRDDKQYDDSKRAFQKAIELGNAIESRLHLGILEYEQLGNPGQAVAHFDELLAVLHSRGRVRPVALSLVKSHTALAYLRAKDVDAAARFASESFTASPEEEAMIASLVRSFEQAGQTSALERPLSDLLALNPLLDFGHVVVGQIASNRKDYEKAERSLTNAIAVNPSRDDYYSARALARYSMKEFERALGDFEKAIEFAPEEGTHRYNKACMLSLLGRQSEALENLRDAVLMDANFALLARTDSDFDLLRSLETFQPELRQLGVIDSSPNNGTERTISLGAPQPPSDPLIYPKD